MPNSVVKLIGALSVALALLFAAPQLAQAQQRAEVTESTPKTRTPPAPEDLRLPAPTGPGQTLSDHGGGVYGLGGGQDAGADAGDGSDGGVDAGAARPPPPLDDASCSAAGGGGDAALVAFLFAAGLLFSRRE